MNFHELLTSEAGLIVRGVLDILIVYYVAYRALLVLRGTRAVQIGLGLGAVFLLYLVAQELQLTTVLSILGALLSSIILIIVVVFQNDIRRGLMRVGSHALFGKARAQETRVIDEVVEAATELARHRIGALIAFEQEANLDEFVGSHRGEEIDAVVSRNLLVSMFIPEGTNKLHDGAVIVRHLRVARAGVFFPMTSAAVDPTYGSRHRAALGITEETDAVVVTVSEERGTISFCFNGNIVSNLDGQNLRASLMGIFAPRAAKRTKRTWRQRLLPGTTAGADAPEALPGSAEEAAAPTTRAVDKPVPTTLHPSVASETSRRASETAAGEEVTPQKRLAGAKEEKKEPKKRKAPRSETTRADDLTRTKPSFDPEVTVPPPLRKKKTDAPAEEAPPPLRKRKEEPPPKEAQAASKRPTVVGIPAPDEAERALALAEARVPGDIELDDAPMPPLRPRPMPSVPPRDTQISVSHPAPSKAPSETAATSSERAREKSDEP